MQLSAPALSILPLLNLCLSSNIAQSMSPLSRGEARCSFPHIGCADHLFSNLQAVHQSAVHAWTSYFSVVLVRFNIHWLISKLSCLTRPIISPSFLSGVSETPIFNRAQFLCQRLHAHHLKTSNLEELAVDLINNPNNLGYSLIMSFSHISKSRSIYLNISFHGLLKVHKRLLCIRKEIQNSRIDFRHQ